ncbi:MAG: hypothetical protein GC192_21125 [Bacteroidetes bacterium]|nr:hypothetical protein [Bacteroidota bacterium]
MLALCLAGLSNCSSEEEQAAALFENRCGSCHLAPSPTDLPKAIWQEKVLPEMGARLGIYDNGYNPVAGLSKIEKAAIANSNAYPKQPLLPKKDWELLKKFILAYAPDTLAGYKAKDLSLENPVFPFSPKSVVLGDRTGSFLSFLGFDEGSKRFLEGDVSGHLMAEAQPGAPEVIFTGASTIVDFIEKNGRSYVTEIGEMPPTEQVLGRLTVLQNGQQILVQDSLHRPVNSLVEDLDGDGISEIVVCEYGNYTGRLTLLREVAGNRFERKTLLNIPGTLRAEARDMNGDGKLDLVVLAAQGDEGVYILFQKPDLQFEAERVLRFSPVWGTSWMEVVDYEEDGDMDIITVNGDNADFSFVNKPYHGVRIFINDGKNRFNEALFYPITGATRVLARDFDEDGDLDLAVCAYFPDYQTAPAQSFVYLENRSANRFDFAAHTFPEAIAGRWLVMAAGDVDGDGDLDLALGSFPHSPTPTPQKYMADWQKTGIDLMILINQLKH